MKHWVFRRVGFFCHVEAAIRRATPDGFVALVGECLNLWQGIEHSLFLIFWHFTLVEKFELPSIVFSHFRAFDQRRVLVDKLASTTLKHSSKKFQEWAKLEARLKKAGNQRDRIVHYQIFYNPMRIEPPYYDLARRHSETAPKPYNREHYMDYKKLEELRKDFGLLMRDLNKFEEGTEEIAEERQIEIALDFLKRKGRLPSPDHPPEPPAPSPESPSE